MRARVEVLATRASNQLRAKQRRLGRLRSADELAAHAADWRFLRTSPPAAHRLVTDGPAGRSARHLLRRVEAWTPGAPRRSVGAWGGDAPDEVWALGGCVRRGMGAWGASAASGRSRYARRAGVLATRAEPAPSEATALGAFAHVGARAPGPPAEPRFRRRSKPSGRSHVTRNHPTCQKMNGLAIEATVKLAILAHLGAKARVFPGRQEELLPYSHAMDCQTVRLLAESRRFDNRRPCRRPAEKHRFAARASSARARPAKPPAPVARRARAGHDVNRREQAPRTLAKPRFPTPWGERATKTRPLRRWAGARDFPEGSNPAPSPPAGQPAKSPYVRRATGKRISALAGQLAEGPLHLPGSRQTSPTARQAAGRARRATGRRAATCRTTGKRTPYAFRTSTQRSNWAAPPPMGSQTPPPPTSASSGSSSFMQKPRPRPPAKPVFCLPGSSPSRTPSSSK